LGLHKDILEDPSADKSAWLEAQHLKASLRTWSSLPVRLLLFGTPPACLFARSFFSGPFFSCLPFPCLNPAYDSPDISCLFSFVSSSFVEEEVLIFADPDLLLFGDIILAIEKVRQKQPHFLLIGNYRKLDQFLPEKDQDHEWRRLLYEMAAEAEVEGGKAKGEKEGEGVGEREEEIGYLVYQKEDGLYLPSLLLWGKLWKAYFVSAVVRKQLPGVVDGSLVIRAAKLGSSRVFFLPSLSLPLFPSPSFSYCCF